MIVAIIAIAAIAAGAGASIAVTARDGFGRVPTREL